VYGLAGTLDLSSSIAETLRQLHGVAASMGDSRERYRATGDERYKQSVANVLPYYRMLMGRLRSLYAMQGQGEMPGHVMQTLDEFSTWSTSKVLAPAFEGIGATLKNAPILVPLLAGVAALYFLSKSGLLSRMAR